LPAGRARRTVGQPEDDGPARQGGTTCCEPFRRHHHSDQHRRAPAVRADGTVTTRHGRPRDLLTVSVGALVVYCYDLAAVRAFAAIWRSALAFTPHDLPDTARAGSTPAGQDRHHVGVLLRVQGTPHIHKFNGIPAEATAPGIPHVRVEVGCLTVHAYDRAAVQSWADCWAVAETTGLRIWPDPDSFDQAEAAERARIARRGSTGRPSIGRPAKR